MYIEKEGEWINEETLFYFDNDGGFFIYYFITALGNNSHQKWILLTFSNSSNSDLINWGKNVAKLICGQKINYQKMSKTKFSIHKMKGRRDFIVSNTSSITTKSNLTVYIKIK